MTSPRPARPDELDILAGLAAREQARPERHVAYLSTASDDIATELRDLPSWPSSVVVGEAPDGWLGIEQDDELGRVWWWGPFVRADGSRWADAADQLLAAARALLGPTVVQEEAAADVRHVLLASWAARNGFTPGTPSVALVAPIDLEGPGRDDVRELGPSASADERDALAALHDRAFPAAHWSGAQLASLGTHRVWVVADGGGLTGYVATEVQADGSLYLDFLAVDEARRGVGLAGELVRAAVAAHRGASHAHLTVRGDNTSARRLYERLGFVEDRVIVPYRIGFEAGG